MGFYDDVILPRVIDKLLSTRPILKARERIVQGLSGEVLELGFGSGLNLPYMPNTVTTLHAVDPSGTARKLAKARLDASPVHVEFSGLDGQSLQLPDASVDAVLTTFTLCTIPDLPRALSEARRVLRPGGKLHFLEHGRSPEINVARWQDRITPVYRPFAGGCHLNREISASLREAGFVITSIDNYYLRGPKVGTYLYEGRAALP
jgi:ubiquinone/menaquinone biosynthesis C-methylase UbiE